ncbi:unnamed protein product [Amoebophrya sp. A25]|nr:unnamed protein product [Amoebophrya sp. A25]|eukprot:GSA25T00019791001.1
MVRTALADGLKTSANSIKTSAQSIGTVTAAGANTLLHLPISLRGARSSRNKIAAATDLAVGDPTKAAYLLGSKGRKIRISVRVVEVARAEGGLLRKIPRIALPLLRMKKANQKITNKREFRNVKMRNLTLTF